MKFFLDTANYQALTDAQDTGLLDGVTTNPTHLSKEGGNVTELVKRIATLLYPNDVSVEVTEKSPKAVYAQAKELAALAPNIVVKIPCHSDYLPIITQLVKEGVALNITLIFSVPQGLSMAKLHVKYISPFVGRLEDIDSDGVQLLRDLRHVLSTYSYETNILAASLRSMSHLHDSALAGADCATLPVTLFQKLLDHPLTDKGIALFDHDWQTLGIKKFPE